MSAFTPDDQPNRLEVSSGAGYPPIVFHRQEDGSVLFEPLFAGAALTRDDFKALSTFGLKSFVKPAPPTESTESTDPDDGGE